MMPPPPAHHPDPQRPVPSPGPNTPGPYTRADAIADGLLFDLPARLGRQFHFTYPVAITAQVWFDAVHWDAAAEDGKARPTGQHETSRITELLWAARSAQYRQRAGTVDFDVHRVPPTGPETRAVRLPLSLTVHPGDFGETVATITHRQAPVAGTFHRADAPRSVWTAAGFDRDTSGRPSPVVTADTLDAILADATDPTDRVAIEATYDDDDAVHIHGQDGVTVTLRPDPVGLFHLQPLQWPLVCHPHDEHP